MDRQIKRKHAKSIEDEVMKKIKQHEKENLIVKEEGRHEVLQQSADFYSMVMELH